MKTEITSSSLKKKPLEPRNEVGFMMVKVPGVVQARTRVSSPSPSLSNSPDNWTKNST